MAKGRACTIGIARTRGAAGVDGSAEVGGAHRLRLDARGRTGARPDAELAVRTARRAARGPRGIDRARPRRTTNTVRSAGRGSLIGALVVRIAVGEDRTTHAVRTRTFLRG